MLTLASMDELQVAKERINKLQITYPSLYENVLHVVHLTRALHFKYQFLGSLLMDEDSGNCSPHFVQGSVLRLYKKEVQSLKNNEDFESFKQLFNDFKGMGYANICLLVLGSLPETLTGATIIQ